jgi:hypothetical protein
MWRLVLVTSMFLTLALGAVAQASPPPIVVESLTIQNEGAGTTLRFTARFAEAFDESAFPQTGTAVVMQADGQRSKCLNVSLVRTNVVGGLATYVGKFNFIYQASVLTGRADLGGSIFDFSAPMDGTPGTVVRSEASSINGQGSNAAAPAVVIRPQPVTITPDPATIDPRLKATAAPEPQAVVAQPAPAAQQGAAPLSSLVNSVSTQPVAWLGLIVVLVAVVSAYFDRKRSLSRATAG